MTPYQQGVLLGVGEEEEPLEFATEADYRTWHAKNFPKA